jgi:signal transduction histidine kinase
VELGGPTSGGRTAGERALAVASCRSRRAKQKLSQTKTWRDSCSKTGLQYAHLKKRWRETQAGVENLIAGVDFFDNAPAPRIVAARTVIRMRWPLRNQIMWPLLAVSLVSLGSVGAINARLATTHVRQRIERQLEGVVAVLEASTFPLTDAVLRQMRDLSSAEFLLSDAAGRPLATSFPKNAPQLASAGLETTRNNVALGPSVEVRGAWYFHTSIELDSPGDTRQGRVLHIQFPQVEYRRTWREAFLPAVVVGVAAVAAVAGVARFVAGRISRSAARVGQEVMRLAQGDFAAMPLPAADDELRDLSVAVNRTAVMLADYEQQVRRTEQMRVAGLLGASVAHEMRNAATGCRMALDLHAESCGANEDEESLVVAKRQLRLMETQLQRFLQLGKSTPDAAPRSEFDLGDLLDDLLPLVRPAAHHAHVHLHWRRPGHPLCVSAAEDDLRQVLLNLLLNALEAVGPLDKGTAGERRVDVEARATELAQAEIVIRDTGPGPGRDLAERLFDPFVTSKSEGAGLGLAVAKQVVEAYDGTIAWAREHNCTRFRVTLPLAVRG